METICSKCVHGKLTEVKVVLFYVVSECHRSGSAFKHSEALYSFLHSSSPNLYSSSVPQKDLVKRFCSGDYTSCCRKSRADLLCDETMLLFAEICDTTSINVDLKLVKSYWREGINRFFPECS